MKSFVDTSNFTINDVDWLIPHQANQRIINAVVDKVGFNSAFMFKYSSRPGTKAAEYTDQVDEDVKQSRLESLIELQKRHSLVENKKLVGTVQDVIVEKESKKSPHQWAGRTKGNIWVVFDKTNESVKDIIKVLITDAKGITLFGQRAN